MKMVPDFFDVFMSFPDYRTCYNKINRAEDSEGDKLSFFPAEIPVSYPYPVKIAFFCTH